MRAVKSVINSAQIQKRAFPNLPEAQLMLKALRDVNLPKFLEQDLPLFDNIIQDLFPGVEKPDSVNKKLMDQVMLSCKELNYQPTQGFLSKIT